MKETLLETLEDLRNQGVDLAETPALFTWRYDEEPDIKFQMLITEVSEDDDIEEGSVH